MINPTINPHRILFLVDTRFSISKAEKMTGLSRFVIEQLISSGVLAVEKEGRREFVTGDSLARLCDKLDQHLETDCTEQETMRILKKSRATVDRLIQDGELKAVKYGHKKYIIKESVLAYKKAIERGEK